ncbi:MAG: transcription-repair coupling factor [Deferribacteraceae bacterium]|jgi:transcription-repair coupling factor (superfamily II helicase)|nr:transcription-repair coupling factor [Deferribacteraceae bacterium]
MPQITHYSNAWGAGRALFISKYKSAGKKLIIASNERQAELFYNELTFFSNNPEETYLFSEYTHDPFEDVRITPEISAKRAAATYAALTKKNAAIITTPYALLKKLPPSDFFVKSIITLNLGDTITREDLTDTLDKLGYLQVEVVTSQGEYCVRGGIIDLYPLGEENPLRIEYSDNELESLFRYDVQTQKKIDGINSAVIMPVSEVLLNAKEMLSRNLPEKIREKIENFGKFAGHHWLVPVMYDAPVLFTAYLPESTDIIMLDEQWDTLFERTLVTVGDHSRKSDMPSPLTAFGTLPEIKNYILSKKLTIVTEVAVSDDAVSCRYRSVKSRFAFEKGNLYHAISQALKEIKRIHEDGVAAVAAMESERFILLLKDFCRDHEIPVQEIASHREIYAGGLREAKNRKTLYIYRQRVSGGFIDEAGKFAIITDEEIFGFARKKSRARHREAFSTTISDIEEGCYVVHIDYGIGVYYGLRHMVLGGLEGDYLEILYDNKELLFVPLEQISQIQKYIGTKDSTPRLASLQSANWAKLKASARTHAAKIAQDLLKLYAERKARRGYAFKDDGELIAEFEETFEYDETEDQFAAIIDVYNDMEKETPMERLICGDVGFGKTEVAMRAACKAVIAGKQVAMLVPTTVLARQHYNTFKERFKNFPARIDYISRFRTDREIRKILEQLECGDLDVIIGTHRLLSKDVRFNDLRLLIIDEEQRFGVSHKEKIAAMRTNIDTVSLSATPIPRTLQLSLSGIRDISVIETPPENRLPVAVKVIKDGDDVKRAILSEMERGGQIFFLHNRIRDINEVAGRIRQLAPHARLAVAHGQTEPKELEKTLKMFYDGDLDILLATTIIENGIDIPNVNAILIDGAANFGLAQLYQLKGRVGRGERRGYCYLMADDLDSLSDISRKRLSIIQQLSDLGSGLKIAMYDLQLRGAGDILGAAQSGFVIKVGYELFLKMISEAVSELQQSAQTETETEVITQYTHYISADYIEDPRIRLDYYRTFSSVKDRDELGSLFDELSGQYGQLKEETVQLGYIMLIKNLAAKSGIIKAGIYPTLLRFEFGISSGADPAKLTGIAQRMNLPYRFAGEYEFVISSPDPAQTLSYGTKFLEHLFTALSQSI